MSKNRTPWNPKLGDFKKGEVVVCTTYDNFPFGEYSEALYIFERYKDDNFVYVLISGDHTHETNENSRMFHLHETSIRYATPQDLTNIIWS